MFLFEYTLKEVILALPLIQYAIQILIEDVEK